MLVVFGSERGVVRILLCVCWGRICDCGYCSVFVSGLIWSIFMDVDVMDTFFSPIADLCQNVMVVACGEYV